MNSLELKELNRVMTELVTDAAGQLRYAFSSRDKLQINDKPDKNNMADVGVNVERLIEQNFKEVLAERYPDISFVGEEFGGSTEKETYFLLDPLDGTTNFVHCKPEYAISFALVHKGEVVACAMAAPEQNVVVTAIKGEGCYCNGVKVEAKERESKKVLLDAEINFADMESLKLVNAFASSVAGVRKAGSTVWASIMMLKDQGCEAIIADHLEPHDVAGCHLALSEAGFSTVDDQGLPRTIASRSLIAAAPGTMKVISQKLNF